MHKKLLVYFVLLSIILSGCWGQRDIEDQGFVIGTGIDLEEEQSSDEIQLRMTNQTVVPPMLGTPGGQGPTENSGTKNVTATGNSLAIASANIDTLSARVPFYEHLKLIVISKDVVATPDLFPSVMDFFLRAAEMRREIKLVIADGEAASIMELEPEGELLPIMYIESTFENTDQTLQILSAPRIGDVNEFLLDNNSFAIPMIKSVENHGHIEGAAVFRGDTDTMVGMLHKDEVKGLNLIKGSSQGGVIDFYYHEKMMDLRITDLDSDLHITVNDPENIKISINIEVQGYVSEMSGGQTLGSEEHLREIEKKVTERVEELAKKAIDKGKKELQIDFFGFNEHLHAKQYDFWEKVKDDWDRGKNLFADSTIDVSAKAVVKALGAMDKTKK